MSFDKMSSLPEGDESLEMARSENGDSTSSELERLENNASPCPSGADSPTERGIAKTRKQEEYILRLIQEASALGTNTLDLSHKGMRQFPSEILEMPQLEVCTISVSLHFGYILEYWHPTLIRMYFFTYCINSI